MRRRGRLRNSAYTIAQPSLLPVPTARPGRQAGRRRAGRAFCARCWLRALLVEESKHGVLGPAAGRCARSPCCAANSMACATTSCSRGRLKMTPRSGQLMSRPCSAAGWKAGRVQKGRMYCLVCVLQSSPPRRECAQERLALARGSMKCRGQLSKTRPQSGRAAPCYGCCTASQAGEEEKRGGRGGACPHPLPTHCRPQSPLPTPLPPNHCRPPLLPAHCRPAATDLQIDLWQPGAEPRYDVHPGAHGLAGGQHQLRAGCMSGGAGGR